LGNLFLFGLYSAGGSVALQGLRLIVILSCVVLIHSFVDFKPKPILLMILILFTYGLSQKVTVRTALFSIPFTVLLFTLWLASSNWNNPNWLFGLLPLLVLWSNIHGSYQLGWGLLAALGLGWFLDYFSRNGPGERKNWLIPGLILLVLVGVCLVKPFPEYGLPEKLGQIPVRALSSAGSSTPETVTAETPVNSTWLHQLRSALQKPLFEAGPIQSAEFDFPLTEWNFIAVPASFILILITIPFFVTSGEDTVTDWLLLSIGLYFGAAFVRTVAYLPLIYLPLLFNLFRKDPALFEHLGIRTNLVTTILIAGWCGVAGGIVLNGGLGALTGEPYHELGFGVINRYESDIPEKILHRYPDERFANSYLTGGYLITNWWPHKKVLIDSKGSAYRDDFLKTLFGSNPIHYLKTTRTEFFLTERTNPAIFTFKEKKFVRRLIQDRGLVVYQLRNNPN
jgi:hypothetical protein